MRHLKRFFFLTVLVCLANISARASHIYGLDFFYEHVSGYTYRVYLVVYGDCNAAIYGNLSKGSSRVEVRNGSTTVANIILPLISGPVEVTPVCARLKDSTKCVDTNYVIPGVGRFIYSTTYTLSGTSANWHFYFNGDFTNHAAGRAFNISNISPGSIVAMDAALNNTIGPNSSPTFTTLPTPFYCINVPQKYNQGAVDKDGDSLSYALVPALAGSTGSSVVYIPPTSATNPLITATGSFSFSSTTGQLSFNPSAVQRALIVQQVTEYRNGIVVGTSSREMTFIILNNCNNTPSSNAIDTNKANIHAVAPVNANTVNICYGTSKSQFLIKAINPSADTIDASVSGLPAGATATITQNNTPDPIIQIDWNLPKLAPGNYNFFVTYRDNGCPLSSIQTQAYTVAVIIPYSISATILAPTQCVHNAYVGFNLSNGVTPRYVNISQNGTTTAQYVDNTGTFADSFAIGIYTVTVSSPVLPCSTSYSLRVVDSGVYPNVPKIDSVFYCLNDLSRTLIAIPDSGATLGWYTIEGKQLSAAPIPRTDSAGVFYWLVRQRFKVCNSLTDTARVYVTKRPVADFILPPSICIDDTASVVFSGSIGVGPIIEYKWNWGDAFIKSGQEAGPWSVYWQTPGTKTIKLIAVENKCSSVETKHTLTVHPNPYAGFNVGEAVCEYDTLRVTYNSKPYDGQTYAWSFQDADTPTATGPGPYLLRWQTPGIKIIRLVVDLYGCTDERTAEVTIHPVPDARILNAPGPVCIGDKIYLKAEGGVSYAWSPADSLLANADGEIYAQILKPTIYRVKVTSDFGCLDSAAIKYSEVEPCCQFSYPNAFTPNADGRNDRFRIVTYGNQLRFELSIYNNWGQRVYYGLDAEEGWDGQFRGKPCEPGTYFYYLNATCFTGRQETHKGDLVLIR